MIFAILVVVPITAVSADRMIRLVKIMEVNYNQLDRGMEFHPKIIGPALTPLILQYQRIREHPTHLLLMFTTRFVTHLSYHPAYV